MSQFDEQLTPIQRFVMRASVIAGILVFFTGVQLTVRGRSDLGQPMAGFGMFVAASMRLGVKELYEKIESRSPHLLERWGRARLFWILFGAAFVLDSLSAVALITLGADLLADYLSSVRGR